MGFRGGLFARGTELIGSSRRQRAHAACVAALVGMAPTQDIKDARSKGLPSGSPARTGRPSDRRPPAFKSRSLTYLPRLRWYADRAPVPNDFILEGRDA